MTPKFEIIDAKPWFVGIMSRKLRAVHRRAVIRLGANIHRELRDKFQASAWVKSLVVDGHIEALGGVTGSAMSPLGIIWFCVSDEAAKYPIRLMRVLRDAIDEILETKTELQTTILFDDAKSERLAFSLGFKQVYDDDGDPVTVPVGDGSTRAAVFHLKRPE